ncbi:hypothetical protein JD844_007834 [Phrynosoma platyrhinos]|uniref:3CxxC-type domain-containing protein n=1 Tax=Phrynosoma platyrhinos TaxID=52577 RepID=A0ABQ7T435_PHRPL|nr:hypothetical protein JD844_007834 [Phrynosoma platyrhinos]
MIVFYVRLQNTLSQASGQVKMKIFRQKCRACGGNIKYEEPIFRDDTVQIVLHNLVQKILWNCYGEGNRTSPIREPVAEGFLEGPHERRYCEACEHGWCMEKARTISLDQPFLQKESLVRPASLVQPIEQAGSWWSCSEMVCLLVVILVIIAFLLNSIK